jgi:hypothetical protein
MGVPAVFACDLASLTAKNIKHYRQRFDLVKRLEHDYGIYRRFQFSGVPAPTDTDWHWWGKLTPDGYGAVVVLRGSRGADQRAVNIPWVLADRTYQVTGLLSGTQLGRFSGRQLQAGELRVSLPHVGQEILELKRLSDEAAKPCSVSGVQQSWSTDVLIFPKPSPVANSELEQAVDHLPMPECLQWGVGLTTNANYRY